jgi:uncharacterized protein (TIGR02118 family)
MSAESVILINLLKAKSGQQEALLTLLRQNTDAVIRNLHGWKSTRLVAANDDLGVLIYSEWETPADVEAMRADPRMMAYMPKIAELASIESMVGTSVWGGSRAHADEPDNRQDGSKASARMVVVYRTPVDVEAFEKHYVETHLPLAMKLPGLRKYEVSQGAITVVAGSPDVHLIGTLHFDDLAAIKAAFASPQGRAAAADRRLYAPDDSGVQMFLFDNRTLHNPQAR